MGTRCGRFNAVTLPDTALSHWGEGASSAARAQAQGSTAGGTGAVGALVGGIRCFGKVDLVEFAERAEGGVVAVIQVAHHGKEREARDQFQASAKVDQGLAGDTRGAVGLVADQALIRTREDIAAYRERPAAQ